MAVILFSTFAPMKMNQNPNLFLLCHGINNKSYQHLLKFLCAIKSIMVFDIFQYSNTYQEKLPIIYANIRV